MQYLQQDKIAREMLAGGSHTPRRILNAVNGAQRPLKYAQHGPKDKPFHRERNKADSRAASTQPRLKIKREPVHSLTVKAN